jgi:hypothetical protein
MCEESVISPSRAFRKMYNGKFRKRSCRTGTGTCKLGVRFASITQGIHRLGMRVADFAVLGAIPNTWSRKNAVGS